MSQFTIKSAVEMGDGAIIPSLGPVTFKSVFPVREGTAKRTGDPYRAQDVILMDGTAEVHGTIWDSPDASVLRGATRVLHSVKGGNNRLSGVSVKVGQDKEGNKRWEIHVSRVAVITEPEGVQTQPGLQAQVAPQTVAPSSSAPAVPQAQAKAQESGENPVIKPDKLDDVITLFRRCYGEAREILKASEENIQSYEGYLPAVQAAAATLFIAARQEGLTAGAAQRYPCCSPRADKELKNPDGSQPF